METRRLTFIEALKMAVQHYEEACEPVMQLWFAKRMKECPRCESTLVRRSQRRGFHERFVYPLFLVWPYKCGDCNIRFLGFHRRYTRNYVKPSFRLAKAAAHPK